jgi:hypothetical protein
MSDVHDGPADRGTSELLEVAYRFGLAVVGLATSTEPPRQRLVATWRQLSRVEGALSGLWPEPHLPADLATLVRDLLDQLTRDGTIELTTAAMDDAAIIRTCQKITSLAFALHQTVGSTQSTPG